MGYSQCGLLRARPNCTSAEADAQVCLAAMDVCVATMIGKQFSKSHQPRKHTALLFPEGSYLWAHLFHFCAVWLL